MHEDDGDSLSTEELVAVLYKEAARAWLYDHLHRPRRVAVAGKNSHSDRGRD